MRLGISQHRCQNCGNSITTSCPSGGNENSDFVILGESPGDREFIEGRPFSPNNPAGRPAGRVLAEELKENHIELHKDCYIVNAINCNVNVLSIYDDPIRRGERALECRNRVYEEIFSQPRRIILAFGDVPLRTILGCNSRKIRVADYNDEIRTCTDFKTGKRIPIMYTFHPSYHAGQTRRRADIKKAVQFYNWLQSHYFCM